jgi:hypothetical protein
MIRVADQPGVLIQRNRLSPFTCRRAVAVIRDTGPFLRTTSRWTDDCSVNSRVNHVRRRAQLALGAVMAMDSEVSMSRFGAKKSIRVWLPAEELFPDCAGRADMSTSVCCHA